MEKTKFLRTSDLARAAGIHPNTVRLYVKWGLLPPVQRSPTGYRLFTQHHLDCLLLARKIYATEYPGRDLRASGNEIIMAASGGDWQAALDAAERHLQSVLVEIDLAETAASLLEKWATGPQKDSIDGPLAIGGVSVYLDISIDILRNWERNGLIVVPRNPTNGYRLYGPLEISRLRIIRMLSHAGYSLMAILRMFIVLEAGNITRLRESLDTPRADEDIFTAADHWLSTLHDQKKTSEEIIQTIKQHIVA